MTRPYDHEEDRYWEDDLAESEPTEVLGRDQPLDHEPTRVLDDRTQVLDERTQVLDDRRRGTAGRSGSSVGASAGTAAGTAADGERTRPLGGRREQPLEEDRTQVLDQRTRVLSEDGGQRQGSGTTGASRAGQPSATASAYAEPTPYDAASQDSAAQASAPQEPFGHEPVGTGRPGPAQGFGGPAGFPGPGVQEPSPVELRSRVVRRQKDRFGRVQLLPGLFGWLVALAVVGLLLTATQRFAGGLGFTGRPEHPASVLMSLDSGSGQALAWGVAVAAFYALGFLVGGFAAGRAARFSGAKQGVSVFLWVLLGAAVATVLNLVFGLTPDADVFPVSAQALGGTDLVSGILGVLGVAVLALVFASIGGLWGTAFHRRADRWGFEER